MRKEKIYPQVIVELKRHQRGALYFYTKNNLGRRYRKEITHSVPNENINFADYIRQQAIDIKFRTKWLRRIQRSLDKIKEIDTVDYGLAIRYFSESHLRDKGEVETSTAKFEEEIENLNRIIKWLSRDYLTGDKFTFNRKNLQLKRGNEPIADFSVGVRKNSNSAKLLKELFGDSSKKVCQVKNKNRKSPVNRRRDYAMYQINNTVGCKLVKKKTKRFANKAEYYLNKDLI